MESNDAHTANDRKMTLRAKLSERRAAASHTFSAFEERMSIAPEMAAISRDDSLKVMLQRIRINAPGVVYGEATEVANSGLPAHLSRKLSLV